MPPSPSALCTTFILALLITLLVASTLRLLAILPRGKFQPRPVLHQKTVTGSSLIRQPIATRVLIVLGSGGHTHEIFCLLKDLDTRKYTHRTYVVSSGDAFSSQRAVEFERHLEEKEKEREYQLQEEETRKATETTDVPKVVLNEPTKSARTLRKERPAHVGFSHYNIALLPRARRVHQPLLTTPFTSLNTLFHTFPVLLSSASNSMYDSPTHDPADLIITNGPATGVIVVLASLILKFLNWRGCSTKGKFRTVYVESFARVTGLSLSGKILVKLVDRFLVQWEELAGGRAEFWGVLV